jgi:HlyD family secretion protein
MPLTAHRGRALTGLAVALLLLAAGAALVGGRRAARVQTAPVARENLRVTVTCAGRLEPPPGGELRATEPGTVAAVLRDDGATVARGEPLVRLDSPDLVARAREARDAVEQLEAEAAAASAEVDQARLEAEHRRVRLAGDLRLLEQGAVARASVDESRLAGDEAEKKLRSAEARLQALVQGGHGERPRVELARERARALDARVASLTVRAPFPGVVYGLPRRAGGVVTPGQVVANVTGPTRPAVRGRVDQPDVPRLQVGQPLLVTFDGLPDRTFVGTVQAVGRDLREEGGRNVGEIVGEIRDPDRRLPLNASVNVEVVVGERSSALAIPRAAVYRDGPRRYVLAVRDGRAERRPIEVGLVGSVDVEVLGGLAEGERVILPGAAPIADGQRVAPVP